MRKFLMAAAVLAVAACAEKAPEAAPVDSPTVAPVTEVAPAATTPDSGAVKTDSGAAKPDSGHAM